MISFTPYAFVAMRLFGSIPLVGLTIKRFTPDRLSLKRNIVKQQEGQSRGETAGALFLSLRDVFLIKRCGVGGWATLSRSPARLPDQGAGGLYFGWPLDPAFPWEMPTFASPARSAGRMAL